MACSSAKPGDLSDGAVGGLGFLSEDSQPGQRIFDLLESRQHSLFVVRNGCVV